MIKMEHVGFRYEGAEILHDVNFAMKDGEFVGILGPNGGGKSTFLRLALGLLKPINGTIQTQEKRIAYIAQTTSISDASFPASVEEVVSLGLVGPHLSWNYKENKNRLHDTLEEWGLAPFRKRLVNELSGGQLQRVKIAKAVIGEPSLLVLDEPDAGMDDESHHALLTMIQKQKARGTSILFVSHHPEDLHEADHVYFIEQGSLIDYAEELERGHHHVSL